MTPSIARNSVSSVPLVLFFIVMLSPWSVRGEDLESVAHNSTVQSSEAERRINLASLIEELEGVNPEIKAARQRWEAAKAVVPQVQTLPTRDSSSGINACR